MKQIIKTLLLSGILLCLSSGVFADGLDNKNAIGMYILGSDNSFGGIQYERRFTDIIGVRFGTYAYYSDVEYSGTPFQANFIVESDFSLYETTWNNKVSSRLFAFGLAGYDCQRQVNYDFDAQKVKSDKMVHSLVGGAGFGFDFIFFDHLSIPIQFGFVGTYNDVTPNLGFCAGAALRYSW